MSFPITKTVSDVAEDVKRTFGDESSVQVTDPDILRWINQGQTEIVSRNQILRSTSFADSVANQADYSLTSLRIQSIFSIQYDGAPLQGLTQQDVQEKIYKGDPKLTATGIPEFWWQWGDVLTLYPTPSSSLVNGIKLLFYGLPVKVTSTEDNLSIPDNYYTTLLEFVMSKAYEMDEQHDVSNNKLGRFDSQLTGLSGDQDKPKQDTYSTITVMPEDM